MQHPIVSHDKWLAARKQAPGNETGPNYNLTDWV
jgi:hypothetical protein